MLLGLTRLDADRPDAGAPAGLAFEVLGPVRAWHDGVEIDLGTPQQRAALAVLLLAEGSAVPVDEAVERLWGEAAPRSARGVLRTYIYRLRRALEDACPGSDLIEFQTGAYRMRRTGYRLDAAELEDLIGTAEDVRRFDATSARDALRAAMRLWRGEALQGVDAPWLDGRRGWLEQRRVDALISLFPLELAGGEPGPVLHAIADLRARLPTHEKLAELQMTGLWARGERSAALAVFEDVRAALGDELGVDPGPELQALHLRILRAEPAPATPGAAAAPARPAPSELPRDGAVFVGRRREIRAMHARLTAPQPQHVGIAGLGGMGKTRLAVRVAHAAAAAFPDGRLFVQVGSTPVEAVLTRLLVSMGVRAEAAEAPMPERLATWRTLTADLRVLVVLDDVAPGADLAPLVPAGDRSAVIATAQRRVLDLPGVRWTRLEALSTSESVELLAAHAGRDRIAAEEATVRRLAEECSNIPLAVEVAAARLTDRPSWTIAELEQQLLDDLASPVVMQEDCAIVDAPLARAESLLDGEALAALHGLAALIADGQPFTRDWAADRLALDAARATALLERLVDANLLLPLPGRRYRCLTLVAAYARRQAAARGA
ncbi:AfsR/SARP family transcriptional regulator [Amnibacterium setariae]|nr:BTAD domain-containing putative transcriptional regulator [Amnibacterium setariae]